MGDLAWTRRKLFGYPLKALRYHAVALGGSGSGKTETLFRLSYGGRKIYHMQVIYLDAKGETKREEEQGEDNAARFVTIMQAAGAQNIQVFPSLYYDGWKGTPTELKNRLLSIIDFSESAFYGDVAANAVDLALSAPTTPRSSSHFLANLRFDRLKAIYANDPYHYARVLNLDTDLLKQVEMRYQVFFSAMAGQLDGTLDYADADAVYLRVRGFALRNEAPRLGRFLVHDFMHYVAERRRPGVITLFIIDEFNALRLREETSILFEQARTFGGSIVISAQGYAGLGPKEYANRILDACSTYILHACSDPFEVSKRAGKRFRLDTSWSEDEEGISRKDMRLQRDWKVPVDAVMQQEEGQAYWIYHGHAQQAQTAQVAINQEHVKEAWKEIQRQEDRQRVMLEAEAQRRQEQHMQKQQSQNQPVPLHSSDASSTQEQPAVSSTSTSSQKKTTRAGTRKNGQPAKSKIQKKPGPGAPDMLVLEEQAQTSLMHQPSIPTPDLDDDEPDRL